MTAQQVIAELSKYPPDMDVFMAERKTDFQYGLLNSVRKKKIGFKEAPEDENVLSQETVIILDEE